MPADLMRCRFVHSVFPMMLAIIVAGCTVPSDNQETSSDPLSSASVPETCVAANANLIGACTGCSLTGGDPMQSCLVRAPEGEIVGDFAGCSYAEIVSAHSDDSPCGLSAALIARDRDGNQVVVEAPYGFDRVVQYAHDPDAYYVFSANRENDNPKNYDAVFRVTLSPAAIQTIVGGTGFGGYSEGYMRWLVVPSASVPDLTLSVRDVLGAEIDSYAFGRDLAAMTDAESMFLTGSEMLSDGNLLLYFWEDGLTEAKGGPFRHVIVSPDRKIVEIAE